MTMLTAHSPLCTSSEHASAEACSASCYDRPKDVGILALIVPERKLRQVQRQVVFADIVKGSHDATLQQTPKAFQIIRVNLAAHVFAAIMVDGLMRKRQMQFV